MRDRRTDLVWVQSPKKREEGRGKREEGCRIERFGFSLRMGDIPIRYS
jgi:hypothetical protein